MSFVSASRCVIMRSAIVCFGCAQEELQSLAVADSMQEAADFALVVARRVDRVLAVPGASVATQPDNQTVSNLVDSTLAQRIQDASTIPRLVLLLRKADEQLATAKNAVMDLEERLRHELMDSVDHVRQLVSTKAAEVGIAALLLGGRSSMLTSLSQVEACRVGVVEATKSAISDRDAESLLRCIQSVSRLDVRDVDLDTVVLG